MPPPCRMASPPLPNSGRTLPRASQQRRAFLARPLEIGQHALDHLIPGETGGHTLAPQPPQLPAQRRLAEQSLKVAGKAHNVLALDDIAGSIMLDDLGHG